MITKFSQIRGNKVNNRLLSARSRAHNLPHVILLSGPSGVGKSSIAKVMALTLDCENPTDDGPCLVCSHCASNIVNNALVQTSHIHIIDCPKVTSLDEINKYCNIIEFAGAQSRHIYIFEEIHAWNKIENAYTTLLQHLDNPPESVYVIMCTTRENVLPNALKYRATRFRFNELDHTEMVELFRQYREEFRDAGYNNGTINSTNNIYQIDLQAKADADAGKGILIDSCLRSADGNPRRLRKLFEFIYTCNGEEFGDLIHYIRPVTDEDIANLLVFAMAKNAQDFINQYNYILSAISPSDFVSLFKDFVLRLQFYAADNTLGGFDDNTRKSLRECGAVDKASEIYSVAAGLYSSMTTDDIIFKLYEIKFKISGMQPSELAPRNSIQASSEKATISNGDDRPSYIPGLDSTAKSLDLFRDL